MTPESVIRLIADPRRMRVLAAVALGAGTAADVARTSQLPHREVATALRRLLEAGLLASDAGGLRPAYEELRRLCQEASVTADDATPTGLRAFVRDGRLVSLPAQQARRRAVLEHVAEASFEAGATYDERAVNDKLKAWCDGSEVDHVAVRRYLVDAKILVRADGVYARDAAALPEPDAAERYVDAMGLN